MANCIAASIYCECSLSIAVFHRWAAIGFDLMHWKQQFSFHFSSFEFYLEMVRIYWTKPLCIPYSHLSFHPFYGEHTLEFITSIRIHTSTYNSSILCMFMSLCQFDTATERERHRCIERGRFFSLKFIHFWNVCACVIFFLFCFLAILLLPLKSLYRKYCTLFYHSFSSLSSPSLSSSAWFCCMALYRRLQHIKNMYGLAVILSRATARQIHAQNIISTWTCW